MKMDAGDMDNISFSSLDQEQNKNNLSLPITIEISFIIFRVKCAKNTYFPIITKQNRLYHRLVYNKEL